MYDHSLHRVNMLHLLVVATVLTSMTPVAGHGRLMDPPARNSMWRLGFPNPVNYNDNELYCGGRVTQWARNKGKCGVCGDPYHNSVKDHEVGGKYANGIISREYIQGGTVEIIVHITANHKGYFEFRICPVEDPKVEVTQECLDTHLMMMANGEGSKYFLPEGKSNQFFNVSIKLPEDVSCKQCVVQWKYRTGNTWDKDESGNFCVGCGPQEEFYNCADVTIHARGSSEKDQQIGNSKPPMPDVGEEISPTVDLLHKKEGKSIHGKINNLKSAADNTISNYGKQKVHFIQKLDSNKYSSWAEPKGTEVKSPFIHLARKGSEGSGRNSSNSVRFVSGGGNLKPFSFTRSQPDQVSGSPWNTGVSESTHVDRIRRRFGYGISSTQDSHSSISTSGMQRTTQETLGISANGIQRSVDNGIERNANNGITKSVDNSITGSVNIGVTKSINNGIVRRVGKGTTRSVDNGISRSVDNVISRSVDNGISRSVDNGITRIVDNGITRSVDNGKSHYSPMATSHKSSIAETQNHSKNSLVTAVSVDDTKLLRKDVMDFHKRLRDVIDDVKVNQKERDSFLRKWKLQKLQRIAAHRALQSVHGPVSKKARSWQTSLINNEVTRPMMRMKQVQTLNSSTPVIVLTPPAQFVQQRLGPHGYTAADATYTKSPNLQLGNKRGYQRSQLPTWLAAAFKFTKRDTEYKTGRKHSMNFNRENSKLEARSDGTNELKKTVFRPQLADVSLGYGNARTPQVSTVMNQIRQFSQTPVHSKSAGFSRVHGDDSTAGVNKPREDDLTDSLNNDIKGGDTTGTESLVRYIVSLLISQMKNDNSGEYTGEFEGRNKSVFADILLSTLAPINTMVKDTTSGGLTWLAPGSASAATTKTYRGRSASKGRQPGTTSNTQVDRHHYSQRQHDNLAPSVRGEANAFSGLILGSDTGNSQRSNKNRVEKYHNWGTAGLFEKRDDVNAEGTSKRTSHSTDKKVIADAFQKTRNSRSDYKDMRNNKQSGGLLLRSQAQASPATPIDHHHIWSSRAGRRRDHYNRHEDSGKPELVCESLVVLSGGMDRWCTDNCNANFCPSSLCVCTAKVSASSPRLINFPLAIPREQTWAQSKHHSKALPRQHSRAVPTEGVFEDFFTPLDRNSRSNRFITATRTAITKLPQQSTGNNEFSYEKLYRHPIITQKPVRKNEHPFSHITNKDKMSLYLENLLGQDTNIKSREENNNSFGPTKPGPHFLLHSASTLEKQKPPYTFDGVQRRGEEIQLNNYHINEDGDKLPQTGRNDIHARFQTLPQIPKLSQRLNWYTNGNSYNLREINNPGREQDSQESRTRVFIQPYSSHSQHLNHGALANEAFSKNGIYNRKEAAGPVYYDQHKVYSQAPVAEPGVRTRAAHSRLVCTAVGAFAGVRHFEDWCLSTCLTTMCPLTVCSCEQQGFPQLLKGK